MAEVKSIPKEQKPEKPKREKRAVPRNVFRPILFNPPVGLPVQWFPNANPRETPWPARIAQTEGRDRLAVSAESPNGTIRRVIDDCPHMSDPKLVTQRLPRGVHTPGAWDFLPMKSMVPAEYQHIDTTRYLIVRLNQQQNLNAFQIAQVLRNGWTEDRVQEVLEDHATAPEGQD